MSYRKDIEEGRRFTFGKNWTRFLKDLDEERIMQAEISLKQMLGIETLDGKTFLDCGSGSGLFSLAAKRLGAKEVHSFDFDPYSVACTGELKNRFYSNDTSWTVEEASVLDVGYMKDLGKWDIVYSWGVLHHTGDMKKALENVVFPVRKNGMLFIAIYNDQGGKSRRWTFVKKLYNRCPGFLRFLIWLPLIFFVEAKALLIRLVKLQNPLPFKYWKKYKEGRGMSKFTDYIDWIGGYPFEVARPEEIFKFYRILGFKLEKFITAGGGHGNNQFVFLNTGDGS